MTCLQITVLGLLLMFPMIAFTQNNEQTGTLQGIISENGTGRPIKDARIDANQYTTFSTQNGYYQITNLPPGQYDVFATASEYKMARSYNVLISKGLTTIHHFQLQPNYSPLAETLQATDIQCHSALLNSTINPMGYATEYYFEYGETPAYGLLSEALSLNSEKKFHSCSILITNLKPFTSYHYRIVAMNSYGIHYGQDQQFETNHPLLSVSKLSTMQLPLHSTGTAMMTIKNPGCGPLSLNLAISPNLSWIASSLSNATIASSESLSVTLFFDTNMLSLGTHQTTLMINHNADNEPNPYTQSIILYVSSPGLALSHQELSFELIEGTNETVAITMTNTGNTDLEYEMTISGNDPIEKNVYPIEYYSILDKNEPDTREGNPINMHRGGPDYFGYMWHDSDDPDGPTYQWEDISQSGQLVDNIVDDFFVGPFPIGFSFSFYGMPYKSFYIASNGYIGFGPIEGYAGYTNFPIHDTSPPFNILAWCWDDLHPRNGKVYYKTINQRLIIQFVNYGRFYDSLTMTAQVIIDANGSITYQYKSIDNGTITNSCTIGIKNKEGTDGLEVAFNMSYIHELMAIQFKPSQCGWLSIQSSTNGIIKPNAQQRVLIHADSYQLPADTYQCFIKFQTNDPIHAMIKMPVDLLVQKSKSDIWISPETLTFELQEGGTSSQKLMIGNNGTGPLYYKISLDNNILQSNTHLNSQVDTFLYPESYYAPLLKGQQDQRVGAKVIANNGGPDASGYIWTDNSEPDGPQFEWTDISKIGTTITDLTDDNYSNLIQIGFLFPYYGKSYSEFYITSNGFIGFGPTEGYTQQYNFPIPINRSPSNILAWCWDDLHPKQGKVVYKKFEDYLIIQFNNYGQFGTSGTVDAQVILHANGTILFQYNFFRNGFNTESCTVGIVNETGTDGLLVAFNASYLRDHLAIQFKKDATPWLNVHPPSGTVLPGQFSSVMVTASADRLQAGIYHSKLMINSNDSYDPIKYVPVQSIVKAPDPDKDPFVTIHWPKSGMKLYGDSYPIQGIGTQGTQSSIKKIDISVDGGITWQTADGTDSFQYNWSLPDAGSYVIRSRVIDTKDTIAENDQRITITVVNREPSSIKISGKHLLINNTPKKLKGICYSPTPIGHDPDLLSPFGDYFTSNYAALYERDLPLIRQMGANAIRIWNWESYGDHLDFMDQAYQQGNHPLYIIVGFDIQPGLSLDPNDPNHDRDTIRQQFKHMVQIHKNHPGLLMWCIGNESDKSYHNQLTHLFSLINDMVQDAHTIEGNRAHPVTTALSDSQFIHIIETYTSSVASLDIWGVNSYRGKSFGSLFQDVASKTQKPMVLLGYGIDAYDQENGKEFELNGSGVTSEYAQALWKEIESADACMGGFWMAYSDEWWKGNHATDQSCSDNDPLKQGKCGYENSHYPDGYCNEEWWGIMKIQDNGDLPDIMIPRPIFYTFQSIWQSQQPPPESITLYPPNGSMPYDQFGWSVSVSGNRMIIGANRNNKEVANAGAAYIYYSNGTQWLLESTLIAPDAGINNYFGQAVDIKDNTAIVSAIYNDDLGDRAGAAYIFSRQENEWVFKAKLLAPDGNSRDYFGSSVALCNNYVAIGATGNDAQKENSGAVYIYSNQTGTWQFKQKLMDPNGNKDDGFGNAVAMTTDQLIVGSYQNDEKAQNAGAVFIYRLTGAEWALTTKLLAPDGNAGDLFGYACAINHNYALIGAQQHNHNNQITGAAYLYQRIGNSWRLSQQFMPNPGTDNDFFGCSVALSDQFVAIGAYGDDTKGSMAGAVWIYNLSNYQWIEWGKLTADKGMAKDYFGNAIALSNNTLVVGAYGNDFIGNTTGAVWIYDLSVSNQQFIANQTKPMHLNLQTNNPLLKNNSMNTSTFTLSYSSHPIRAYQSNVLDTKGSYETNTPQIIKKPLIYLSSIPEYGDRIHNLEGEVLFANPDQNSIAVYIYNQGWWNKPDINSPITPIQPDGTFQCDITTAESDHVATQIAVFLISNMLTPSILQGESTIPNEMLLNSLNYQIIPRCPANKPSIIITQVPTYGDRIQNLEGIVCLADQENYKLAVYIDNNGWHNKPSNNAPVTQIDKNGQWSCDITTQENDHIATRIAIFLLPIAYNPPILNGEKDFSKHLYFMAIDVKEIERKPIEE